MPIMHLDCSWFQRNNEEAQVARKYRISVRKTNGLEIWFVSSRDIYIKDKYGWQNFTRWDVVQRNFYSNHWRPFARALRDYRYLDMGVIRRLATLYDISIRAGSLPDWVNKSEARIIPEKGRARNNERFYDRNRY